MSKEYIIALVFIVIVIILFAWVGIVSGNITVNTSASVPIKKENCWTTYQANSDCINKCLYIKINY